MLWGHSYESEWEDCVEETPAPLAATALAQDVCDTPGSRRPFSTVGAPAHPECLRPVPNKYVDAQILGRRADAGGCHRP